ncbi:uncharacterized protein LOC127094126 [Lathyrus oleraceus]|uniref:uncharacterized protein LOC127094126 n=1 Tax=Pisum sativum TaxID=3888 RepID=UPI0021CE4138|nr:uncharacterized protein LOC127094126 [Pisum sativum]
MVAANVVNIVNNNERDHYSAKPSIFDVDGYVHLVNAEGNTIARSAMTDQQNKYFKNHPKAKIILLNFISYTEYEKITNKDFAKSIFDSMRMTLEGNAQMLVTGLKVLDKGFSTVDRVKKIIRSLHKKWRLMVIALKLAKDINSTSLEELVSFLKSREIELEEDEFQKRGKSVSLKSKPAKTRVYQDEEESNGSDEGSEDDDELSLISNRKKQGSAKEVTCFGCNEPGHYKNECSTLKKDKRPKKFFSKGKKGLMATWDDSKSEEEDFDEEQANVSLMTTTDPEESCLSEILEKYKSLHNRYKDLKQVQVASSGTRRYSERSKGYIIFNTETRIVEESIHVRLDDKLYPEKSKLVEKFADMKINFSESEDKDSEGKSKDAEAKDSEATQPEATIGSTHQKKSILKASHSEELILGVKDASVRTRSSFKPFEETLLGWKPKDFHVIGTKWVFIRKLNEKGEVIRNKARLVAQVNHNIIVYQMYVKIAILNGYISEEVDPVQKALKDGRLEFVDKQKPQLEKDVETKVEALFIEPVDIMVVDIVDEAGAKDIKASYED